MIIETDLQAPFDPTAYGNITGAQLLQLVSGAFPQTDKGMILVSADALGVPEVPNAAVTTKWQKYVWSRVQEDAVTLYVWNPNRANDATYLKWQAVTEASIADLSITNAKLAPGCVTDDKVTSVDVSKIIGLVGAYMPIDQAAGGDLTGNYPDPDIAANAVDSTKLSSDAAVDANRAVGTNHIKDSAVTLAKIANDAVETVKIKDANVTLPKLKDDIINDATAATAAPGDLILFGDISDSNKTKKGTVSDAVNAILTPSNGFPQVKALVAFVGNGSTGVNCVLIGTPINVTSVSHPSTGNYTVTFDVAIGGTSYALFLSCKAGSDVVIRCSAKASGSASVVTFDTGGSVTDCEEGYLMLFDL